MKAEKEAEKAPGINSKNTNSNLICVPKIIAQLAPTFGHQSFMENSSGACQVRKQRGKNQQIKTSKKTFNSQQYYKGVE